MRSKLRFFFLLLMAGMFIVSCSKHDDVPVTPKAELLDTLGAGWQRVKIDTTLTLSDVFFVNNQVGFACGTNYLGKTVDGGLNWSLVIPDSLKEGFINLFFVDANNGWATGANFLLRTRDGGSTWQKAVTGAIYDVQFFDANNGYLTNYTSGSVYKTTDGGITLQVVKANIGHSLYFMNAKKGWISSSYLYRTNDSCASFTNSTQSIPFEEYALQFTDSLHGWIAGPVIYRTLDGGATYETLASDLTAGGDISFFDNNNGYILSGNKIYSTTDGGKTLTKVSSVHKAQLYEIHFTDINHGWATGNGGYVYRYVKP